MKYTIECTFLGKPFRVKDIEATSKEEAQNKVKSLLVFNDTKPDHFKEATDLLNKMMGGFKK
mgnify:CR=1 FL=1